MTTPSTSALYEKATAKFLSRVLKTDGCWLWQGKLNKQGYGWFTLFGKRQSAHRSAHELLKGEIGVGLFVDHICMNKGCVNPDHLRAVTPRINAIENSDSLCAKLYRRTHCSNGHPFTEKNTYIKKSNKKGNQRACRICRRIWATINRDKRKLRKTKGHSACEKLGAG